MMRCSNDAQLNIKLELRNERATEIKHGVYEQTSARRFEANRADFAGEAQHKHVETGPQPNHHKSFDDDDNQQFELCVFARKRIATYPTPIRPNEPVCVAAQMDLAQQKQMRIAHLCAASLELPSHYVYERGQHIIVLKQNMYESTAREPIRTGASS
jgi:hypothetical protein